MALIVKNTHRKSPSTNMAAPVDSGSSCWDAPEVYKHHEQKKICISRPKYREGRRAKAVKVYTINLESRYLMVQGVPAIGVMEELVQRCALYGAVEEYRPLDEYPAEEFTEVYLVKFQKLTSARAAKRNLDEKSFYGGVLHVCYVPEYETVEDTRLKLQDRRSYVARVARNRARKSRDKERICERPTPSETVTPDRTRTGQPQSSYREGTGGTSGVPHHSGFPLLPPPPREHGLYGPQYQPTEDKMGTLHNATPHTHQQQLESLSSDQTASRGQSTDSRLASSQTSVVRFVPRTAHLQNRKRKVDEVPQDSSTISEETGPLIGPKLPESPKLNMEDESLNTTVNLIRNTMKQVESASDHKPVEKKIKPRRRI
ncbi:unnamed protein product [Menidia menidia]|uniref:RNA-binding protein 48 n=1 Tax=Menidia menidia TaxID=238744 RepID=A0A8S4BZC0_9TELE|nr:unnamed protein product [Menidia menidia]